MFAADDEAAAPFVTPAFTRGRNVIVKALLARTPFIAITGTAGSGRTTLLDAAFSALAERLHVVWASAGGEKPLDLGTLLAKLLGKPEGWLGSDDIGEAFAALTEVKAASVLRVLVIEEAEKAPPELLGYLLLLSTLLGTRSALLQVVLVGPPDLREMLHPEIVRRINTAAAQVRVDPMSAADSRSYVEHRLRLHGVAADGALAPAVIDDIVRDGRGNPGKLDSLLALELGDLDGISPARPPPARAGSRPAVDTASMMRVPADPAPSGFATAGGRASVPFRERTLAEAEWDHEGSLAPPREGASGRRKAALFVSVAALALVAVGGSLVLFTGWDPRRVAPLSSSPPALQAERTLTGKAVPAAEPADQPAPAAEQPSPAAGPIDQPTPAAGPADQSTPVAGPADQPTPAVGPGDQSARSAGQATSQPAEPVSPPASPPPASPSPASASPAPSPMSPQPSASDTPPGSTVAAPPPQPALAPETIAALITRGEAMLREGDIVAARLLFERAASGSDAAAVLAGKTYDPAYLAHTGARGIKADPEEAAKWYMRASAAGNREAEGLLLRLRASRGAQ